MTQISNALAYLANIEQGSIRSCAKRFDVKRSTLWHHKQGRHTKEHHDKAQQYLTEQEEKALMKCILNAAQQGVRLPRGVKLRWIAYYIRLQRHSNLPRGQRPPNPHELKPPGRNYTTFFYDRAKLSQYVTAGTRENKLRSWSLEKWLEAVEPQISATKILEENIYTVIVRGVELRPVARSSSLINCQHMEDHLRNNPKGSVITVIECFGIGGHFLTPFIICPAKSPANVLSRSPQGWFVKHSANGSLDRAAVVEWIKGVFDPETSNLASGRPRFLISDDLDENASPDLRTFCYNSYISVLRDADRQLTKRLPHGSLQKFAQVRSVLEKLEQDYRPPGRLQENSFLDAYYRARKGTLEMQDAESSIIATDAGETPLVADVEDCANPSQGCYGSLIPMGDLKALIQCLQNDISREDLSDGMQDRIGKLMDAAMHMSTMLQNTVQKE